MCIIQEQHRCNNFSPNTGDSSVREADVVVGPLIILDAYQESRNLMEEQMDVGKAASPGIALRALGLMKTPFNHKAQPLNLLLH